MRTIWEEMVAELKASGVKDLRKKNPRAYMWLYRHDREWLQNHSPSQMNRRLNLRIDWEKRDQELAEEIEKAIAQLSCTTEKPVQMTIAVIGRSFGKLALIQQHLQQLPLTAAVLNRVVEDRLTFAARRVFWIAAKFQQESHIPHRWELIRRAGVERLKDESIVQTALESAMRLVNRY